MTRWNPTRFETCEHQISDSEYSFAIEKSANILYLMFCRFETSHPPAPALMLPKHKDRRK